jgi:hypothetical protein
LHEAFLYRLVSEYLAVQTDSEDSSSDVETEKEDEQFEEDIFE